MKYKRLWVIIVAFLISLATFFARGRWPEQEAMLTGISTSVGGAMIFWFLTNVLRDNSEREHLAAIIRRLENINHVSGSGLIDIHKRQESTDKFWVKFSNDATHTFTVSGRTLTRFLEGNVQKKAFTNALNRIAKRHAGFARFKCFNWTAKKVSTPTVRWYKEPIRLIMYSDEGLRNEAGRLSENLASLMEEKGRFREYLQDIWGKWSPQAQSALAVYEVERLPYLYCNNGEQCVTGTYFDNRSDKMNLQLVFRCGSDSLEHEYTEDFNAMLMGRNVQRITDLTTWVPNP